MKIGIGNDHVALEYKLRLKEYIEEKYDIEVIDYGTSSTKRFDYPISAQRVSQAVINHEVDRGILICGTGVGMGIAANKYPGIRCVTCSEPYSAKLSREHNNSNVLSFGSRVVGIEVAKMIIDEWIQAEYEGGRHQKRLDMIESHNLSKL